MYGLVHRQTNGKNRKREWNGKIYFWGIIFSIHQPKIPYRDDIDAIPILLNGNL